MFGRKEKEDPVHSVVTTTKAKYFGIVERNARDDGIVLPEAYEMKKGEADARDIARHFIKSRLYGDNKRVELTDTLIESVAEAPDATRVVRTYEALLPQAEKRALGVMTYKALEDLMPK